MHKEKRYDFIVVGAGPSGTTVAYSLANQGYSVLVLDKKKFPRDKVCGDGLIKDSIQCFKKIGVYETIQKNAWSSDNLYFYSPNMESVNLKGQFWTLKRQILDKILLENAVQNGAEFQEGHVIEVCQTEDHTTVTLTSGEKVDSKYLIVATGANIGLLRKNRALNEHGKPSAVAIRGYMQSDWDLDGLCVGMNSEVNPAYGWIFPMGNKVFNVGFGVFYRPATKHPNLKMLLDQFLERFPELTQTGKWLESPQAAMLRIGLNHTNVVDGRIVAVGEAIQTTLPLIGEGIGKAMETGLIVGSILGKAMKDDNVSILNTFNEELQKTYRSVYAGMNDLQTLTRYPLFINLMVWMCQKSTSFRDLLSPMMQGETKVSRPFTSLAKIVEKINS